MGRVRFTFKQRPPLRPRWVSGRRRVKSHPGQARAMRSLAVKRACKRSLFKLNHMAANAALKLRCSRPAGADMHRKPFSQNISRLAPRMCGPRTANHCAPRAASINQHHHRLSSAPGLRSGRHKEVLIYKIVLKMLVDISDASVDYARDVICATLASSMSILTAFSSSMNEFASERTKFCASRIASLPAV